MKSETDTWNEIFKDLMGILNHYEEELKDEIYRKALETSEETHSKIKASEVTCQVKLLNVYKSLVIDALSRKLEAVTRPIDYEDKINSIRKSFIE